MSSMAHSYYNEYDAEQLLELLAVEWSKAEVSGMPTRATESTGVRIAKRLMTHISNEPEVASVTVATISAQVLEHIKYTGYDLSTYEIPIAIMIAYLVKAVLHEWKEGSETRE